MVIFMAFNLFQVLYLIQELTPLLWYPGLLGIFRISWLTYLISDKIVIHLFCSLVCCALSFEKKNDYITLESYFNQIFVVSHKNDHASILSYINLLSAKKIFFTQFFIFIFSFSFFIRQILILKTTIIYGQISRYTYKSKCLALFVFMLKTAWH